jgi:F1F0 ATPase subunit 2
MNEQSLMLLAAFLWGLVLGTIYFAGLWYSIRFVLNRNHTALWMSVSFLFRTLLVLAGFYWIMDNNWLPLVISLTGFLLVRTLLIKRLGANIKSPILNKIAK